MLLMVTVLSWLTIGLTLDLLGVFDDDHDDDDDAVASSSGARDIVPLSELVGPGDAALADEDTEFAGGVGEYVLSGMTPEPDDFEITDTAHDPVPTDAPDELTVAESKVDPMPAEPTATSTSGSDILAGGTLIAAGVPAQVDTFDTETDTIVFAYDPNVTPSPAFTLDDGDSDDEKLFTMNGEVMFKVANAAAMSLQDVKVFETHMMV